MSMSGGLVHFDQSMFPKDLIRMVVGIHLPVRLGGLIGAPIAAALICNLITYNCTHRHVNVVGREA